MEISHLDQVFLEQIARKVAKEEVRDTLIKLGIDHSDPIAAQRHALALREIGRLAADPDHQADLAHLRRWRTTFEGLTRKGTLPIIGSIIFFVAAFLRENPDAQNVPLFESQLMKFITGGEG